MKLKLTKTETPPTDDKPKSKKLKVKMSGTVKNQYGTYSGIVTDEGKSISNPTELEAVTNMAKYAKKNMSDQSDAPSNVYRPKFSHLGLLYNKNTKKKNENQS